MDHRGHLDMQLETILKQIYSTCVNVSGIMHILDNPTSFVTKETVFERLPRFLFPSLVAGSMLVATDVLIPLKSPSQFYGQSIAQCSTLKFKLRYHVPQFQVDMSASLYTFNVNYHLRFEADDPLLLCDQQRNDPHCHVRIEIRFAHPHRAEQMTPKGYWILEVLVSATQRLGVTVEILDYPNVDEYRSTTILYSFIQFYQV